MKFRFPQGKYVCSLLHTLFKGVLSMYRFSEQILSQVKYGLDIACSFFFLKSLFYYIIYLIFSYFLRSYFICVFYTVSFGV